MRLSSDICFQVTEQEWKLEYEGQLWYVTDLQLEWIYTDKQPWKSA